MSVSYLFLINSFAYSIDSIGALGVLFPGRGHSSKPRYPYPYSEEAKQTLAYAKEVIFNNGSDTKELLKIAEAQASVGHYKEARSMIVQLKQKLDDHWLSSEALSWAARVEAQAGLLKKAQRTIRKIKEPEARIQALCWVAAAEAKSGQFIESKKTFIQAKQEAKKMYFEQSSVEELVAIAKAETQTGQIEEAKQTVQEILDESSRAEAFYWITKFQLNTKDASGALETAKLILHRKNEFLPQIAAICIEQKNKDLFKAFLPLIAYYLNPTYMIVGLMSKIYPDNCIEIADLLKDVAE